MELYEIKKQLKKEKTNYYDKNLFKRIFHILVGHPDIKLYKIMKDAKMYRFYKEVNRNSKKYSIELYGKFGKNLLLCHAPIIVNGYSSIGDNCILHRNELYWSKTLYR